MPDRDIPTKAILGAIAFGLLFVVGAIFFMSESGLLKAIGTIALLGYLVIYLGSDWIAAWSNERHVEANPHLLRNEAIGEAVTVNGDFRAQSGLAMGFVFLNGERWKASFVGDHVPKDGDVLEVCGREGLTLVVRIHGEAHLIG